MSAQFHVTTSLRTIKGDDVSMQIKHIDVNAVDESSINLQDSMISHTDMSFINNYAFTDFYDSLTSADVEETTIQS